MTRKPSQTGRVIGVVASAVTELPCPLCDERRVGIDGLCPCCWLTLARLETGHVSSQQALDLRAAHDRLNERAETR